MINIVCPYCKEQNPKSLESLRQMGFLTKQLKPNYETKAFLRKPQKLGTNARLNAANEIVDITCKSCKNIFQYNTRTQEVLP